MKLSKTIQFALLALIFMLITYITYVFFLNRNFRVMDNMDVYRAGQFDKEDWARFQKDFPFNSVLNLQGENVGKPWYEEEINFLKLNSIPHENISLSADKEPDLATMDTLVDMMRTAPKPLLIHCKRGADRSGLAAALYAYAIDGKAASEADDQLSLYYGHFPWYINETMAMDRAFSKYVAARPMKQQKPDIIPYIRQK